MGLTDEQLRQLYVLAVDTARHVGRFVADKVDTEYHKGSKGGSEAASIVTEIDYRAQAFIHEALSPSCDELDLAWLGEESPCDGGRFEKQAFWSVDPLDGTLTFTEGNPGYAVSIALVQKDGTPLLGVVYDPAKKRTYSAMKGHGTYVDDAPFELSDTQADTLTVIVDRSMLSHPQIDEGFAAMDLIRRDIGCTGVDTISHAGAALHACWVLENSPAVFFKFPREGESGGSLWDYAATVCIFNELGLPATDIFGAPLDLNRKESTYCNHKGLLYASSTEIAERVRKRLRPG